MKIENNGLTPLTPNRPEAVTRVEKKANLEESNVVQGRQDKAEMSKNARLLAKARAELGRVDESDSANLTVLKQKIERGQYTVSIGDLAKKLTNLFFPKEVR